MERRSRHFERTANDSALILFASGVRFGENLFPKRMPDGKTTDKQRTHFKQRDAFKRIIAAFILFIHLFILQFKKLECGCYIGKKTKV